MPWGEQAWAASARARHKRKHRQAGLARGPKGSEQMGAPDATAARFLSATAFVEDFRYVEDDGDDLIVQARARLMWGHRLTQRGAPFDEIVTRFEWALDTQDVNRALLEERRLRRNERMKTFRDKAKAKAKVKEWNAPVKTKRRKKLKNRTRQERIEDLRQAIGGE